MKYAWARAIYFYLVSLITLIIIVINGALLANMALKAWVFPRAGIVEDAQRNGPPPSLYLYRTDEKGGPPLSVSITCKEGCELTNDQKLSLEQWVDDYANWKARVGNVVGQRQLEAVRAISFLVVAIPIFIYHWMIVRRDAARTRREAAAREGNGESEI